MSWLRVLYRAPLLVALTLVEYLLLVLTLPFRRWAPRWQLRARNAIYRSWSRGFGRIVGMRIECRGTPPAGPFFLVTNHVSYMDIHLLGGLVDTTFVAKADLRRWPILGHIFQTADTIFIDRGRKRDVVRVMERIGDCHEHGLGVTVFPEGTSGSGEEILRFKPSLLQYAAGRDYPVHHAVIHYRTPPGWPVARDIVCWWGDAPFVPHFPLFLRLPYFEAVIEFGGETLHDRDRKVLAEKLRDAMLTRFVPSV